MFLRALACAVALATSAAHGAETPFPYVWGQAYHILPQTHSDESGYFSLCEGLDGRIYVGTAKYQQNAYLVLFDPRTETQRVVLDVNRVCGLTATGYAAQAKIHTRNFVGPSGIIYAGSKQGYRRKGDRTEYPGGYVLTYDPQTDTARSLGMSCPGQGVIDVVADEARGLLYIVTCEDQHWMAYDTKRAAYRELGPLLTPYATTLIDRQGRAKALTADFRLACYDPTTREVSLRDIQLGGRRWTRPNRNAIPTWQLAADEHTAWLILMNDPTLLEIDLEAEPLVARSHGKLIEGRNPDSRCALSIAPDGRIYAIVRIDNDTGFGKGYLHWLIRYDPKTRRREKLGVLAVRNPDFFDFGPGPDGKRPPWSHGYHRLPDGTLTPLHAHMALLAARDGTIYVTILYPFTLLRIEL